MQNIIVKRQIDIINTIKLLIIKDNQPLLLEKLDFENDDVFVEPLLFIYFNYNLSQNILIELMQGYFIKPNQTFFIKELYNKKNVAYVPNIGYFKKNEKLPFEKIILVKDTKIEILKYYIGMLDNIFNEIILDEAIVSNEILVTEELFEKNINFINNAFQFIKRSSFNHFRLIELCCARCVMFRTDPKNTNSFATIKAHGMAFFNVYQDEYDEVFFVDDIAHQTGHIILTTLLYNRKLIFKIDENQGIGELIKQKDYRNIYTLLHALYTYYTTFKCLDDCLSNNCFTKNQEIEAIARIGFYLNKCTLDLQIFDKIIHNFKEIESILTPKGIEIYSIIKSKYLEVYNKWNPTTKHFDYRNQTYNFALKNFLELNK